MARGAYAWHRDGLPPAEVACRLARSVFWRDGRRRFTTTPNDPNDLELQPELSRALVLALSQLPRRHRRPFADAFYARRISDGFGGDERRPQMIAAAMVLRVIEIVAPTDLCTPRIVDLLAGAAQGDDLSVTPPAALRDLQRIMSSTAPGARDDDPDDPVAAVLRGIVETLAPASEEPDTTEVAARVTWAALKAWPRPAVLELLLEIERTLVCDDEP